MRTESRRAGRGQSVSHAFTLVELLVVVAIIALLLAILLPALGRAREVATMTVCQSTLRQQGIAMLSYASEYKDHIPFRPERNSSGGALYCGSGMEGGSLEWLLAPYMGAEGQRPEWRDTGTRNTTVAAYRCPGAGVVGGQNERHLFRSGQTGPYAGYQSALFHAYMDHEEIGVSTDHDPSGGVTYAGAARLTVNYFTYPNSQPYMFCADTKSPGGVCGDDLYNQHASWHMRSSTNWHRPAIFMDGHGVALTDPLYTAAPPDNVGITGPGHDPNGEGLGFYRYLRNGPYSTYTLSKGLAYGGDPPHKPFEFWLDEY